MSSNEPEPTLEEVPSETTTEDPPPPPADDPEPVEEPPPPPPEQPTQPIVFEPATWYEVTTVCLTQDKGNGQSCPNLNVTATDSPIYSNAGQPVIVCGVCGQPRTILSATRLDPQPEMT